MSRGPEVRRGGGLPFAQVVSQWMCDPRYSSNLRTLYGILATYADTKSRNTGKGKPFRSALAGQLGVSESTLDRTLCEGECAGLFRVERRALPDSPKGHDASIYHLQDAEFWAGEWVDPLAPGQSAADSAKAHKQARIESKRAAGIAPKGGRKRAPKNTEGGITGDATSEIPQGDGGVMGDARGGVMGDARGGVMGDGRVASPVTPYVYSPVQNHLQNPVQREGGASSGEASEAPSMAGVVAALPRSLDGNAIERPEGETTSGEGQQAPLWPAVVHNGARWVSREAEAENGAQKGTQRLSQVQAPRQAPAMELPEDFALNDGMRVWAQKTYPRVDVDHATAKFVSYQRAEGNRRRNWYEAWQRWITDENAHLIRLGAPAVGDVALVGQAATARPSTTDQRVQQALEAGRRLQALADARRANG